MKRFGLVTAGALAATALNLFSIGVNAHHSAAPFYDDTKTVVIHGVVTKFVFVNPHPFLYVDAPDDQGVTQEWVIEFAGPVRLQKIGWTPETFKPGEIITATGHPPKAAGTYGMFSPRIEREDGTVVPMAGAQGGAGAGSPR